MPEICSCGAQLPPDALFCHKCGKAQREIVDPEPQSPPVPFLPPEPAAAAPVLAQLPLNFRNPVAVRIALLVAVSATLLSFIPFVNWIAAGFFAVFFYRRRTGSLLNLAAGIRMGWITGLLMFAIMALFLALSVVMLQAAGGIAAFQEQFRSALDPKVIESLKALQSGPEIVRLLLQFFIFSTLLSMAGGALGAKLVGGD